MGNLVPTIHINAQANQMAKVVIMPGDPLRAKYIAENYLTDVVQINSVRNMLMFTGKYQGTAITIASSGMGCASVGIYAYELFKFYDVDCIIRIGSAGAYQAQLNLYDLINVDTAYSESTFAKYAFDYQKDTINASEKIKGFINQAAAINKLKLTTGLVHSSDVFYRKDSDYWKTNDKIKPCLAVEMEAFGLFSTAWYLKKDAACILTISDSFITKSALSSDLRQLSFNKMMQLALSAAVLYSSRKER